MYMHGRSQLKVALGSVLMYIGVFAIEEQYITVIITEFSQIYWGQLTPITKPSFAPVYMCIVTWTHFERSWAYTLLVHHHHLAMIDCLLF